MLNISLNLEGKRKELLNAYIPSTTMSHSFLKEKEQRKKVYLTYYYLFGYLFYRKGWNTCIFRYILLSSRVNNLNFLWYDKLHATSSSRGHIYCSLGHYRGIVKFLQKKILKFISPKKSCINTFEFFFKIV